MPRHPVRHYQASLTSNNSIDPAWSKCRSGRLQHMKYYSMDEARLLNHNGQIKAVSPTNVTTLYTRKKKSAIKTATVTIVPEVESKVTSKFSKERLVACIDINFVSDQDDAGLFDSFASNIAESTYDGMNVDNVIKENCSHLTKEQQKDLRELLLQHEKLFDGTLRTYTDKKMDIELLPEASAVWRCLSTAVLRSSTTYGSFS